MTEREHSSDSADEQPASAEISGRIDLNKEALLLSGVLSQQVRGHHAKTLLKHEDFTVVLLTLSAGATVAEHRTAQRVSIQVLAGHVQIRVPSEVVDLPAQCLLALGPATPHDVHAIEDSALLLTVARPR